jgi:hypothetical protein
VVLSPSVQSADIARDRGGALLLGPPNHGRIQFDATMVRRGGLVTASGCGARVSGERWSASARVLTFDVRIAARSGVLTLTVHAHRAIAAGGKNPNDWLDGNTDPAGDSGVAPNGDDYEWQVPCAPTVTATYGGTADVTDTYSLYDDNLPGITTGTATETLRWTEQDSVIGSPSGGVVVGTPSLQVNGRLTFTDPTDPGFDCTANLSTGPGLPRPLPQPAGPEGRTTLTLAWDTATREVSLYAHAPDISPALISSGVPGGQCANGIGISGPGGSLWPGYVTLTASALPWSNEYDLAYSQSGYTVNATSKLSVGYGP